jgi:hypothetical protein
MCRGLKPGPAEYDAGMLSHSNATYAPRRKCENTVVTDAYEAGGCGLDHLARYTVQWRALMSMAMNLRVLYKVGNFLTT